MNKYMQVIIGIGSSIICSAAWSADLSIPNTFTAGSKAVASEVNDNFEAVETAVNSKQDRVTESCPTGQTLQAVNADGTVVCDTNLDNRLTALEAYSLGLPAGCQDLLTNMDMWNAPAVGLDLRKYTNSQLHWMGCNGNGCAADSFYCTEDATGETLSFGTNSAHSVLRMVVDVDDSRANFMPTTTIGGCCTSTNQDFVCNAFDSSNNGVAIDPIAALCNALGYQTGIIVRELLTSNSCPEVHATQADGKGWSTDFLTSPGYGAEYRCTGFRRP